MAPCITEELFDCIMNISEEILLCGGEVNRAEDSLKRMLAAYDAQKIDVFIITSSIVVTVHTATGQVFTQTRRITDTANDYTRLHGLNALSRDICQHRYAAEDIRKRLEDISGEKSGRFALEVLMYALIASAFSLFFGGGLAEALTALVVGSSMRLVILLCDKKISNKVFTKFVASAFAAAIAFAACACHLIPTVDHVIVGNIMTLIPGIGFTTALKDLLIGDSLTGTLRTIEACIVALAIAMGYFAVAFVAGGIVL